MVDMSKCWESIWYFSAKHDKEILFIENPRAIKPVGPTLSYALMHLMERGKINKLHPSTYENFSRINVFSYYRHIGDSNPDPKLCEMLDKLYKYNLTLIFNVPKNSTNELIKELILTPGISKLFNHPYVLASLIFINRVTSTKIKIDYFLFATNIVTSSFLDTLRANAVVCKINYHPRWDTLLDTQFVHNPNFLQAGLIVLPLVCKNLDHPCTSISVTKDGSTIVYTPEVCRRFELIFHWDFISLSDRLHGFMLDYEHKLFKKKSLYTSINDPIAICSGTYMLHLPQLDQTKDVVV